MKIAITTIAIILAVVALLTLIRIGNAAAFNGGICEICGGRYEFEDCGGGRVKTYIYECDTCGHLTETMQLMNKNAD